MSCETQSDGESNIYEQLIVFIYGESDATDYFLNLEPFSTTKAAAAGFANIWNIIWPALCAIYGFILDNILTILLVWIGLYATVLVIAVVTGTGALDGIGGILMVLPLLILIFAVILAILSLIVLCGFMIFAVLFDLASIFFAALGVLGFGICRLLEYLMIDLGWGELLLKNFKHIK